MGSQAQALNLPALGSELSGGIFAGITTGKDGVPYALILLAASPAGELKWKAAMAWAADLGEGADLPNRVESAMLFANLPGLFFKNWHWTNEQHASTSDYAWFQHFTSGSQSDDRKGAELRARAVRRLPIQSLVI